MTQKAKKKITLAAEKRTVFGKKVKALRRTGIIPANIFGSDIKSQAIQAQEKELLKVLTEAGMTHVIYVAFDSKEIPVLIVSTHRDSLTEKLLHIDLKKVNLKEKVEAEVPVEITGENDFVKSGEADVLIVSNTVRIEALPTDIPESFSIDISTFTEIGANFSVDQLPKSDSYTFIDEPGVILVQLTEAKKEEAVPQESPSPESVEATEEKPAETEEVKPEGKKEKEE